LDRLVAFTGVALLAAAVAIIVYYAVTIPIEGSFGERYVTAIISPPYPLNQITTFKPVTLITYFFFCGTVLTLQASKSRLANRNSRVLRALLITASFAAAYEFIWNMFAWFTSWLRNGGALDLIANTFHDHIFPPVNFNFATKVSFLIFAICLYSWHFLERVKSENKPVRAFGNSRFGTDQ
jgi:hypothetical protein